MNKLIAVVIVLALSVSAAVRAESLSCNSQCVDERSQCIETLGAKSVGNCGDGFRLCVQRCDPRRMNTALLESSFSAPRLAPVKGDRTAQSCTSRCASAARLCVEGGNPASACHGAQLACAERCDSH